MSPSTAGPSWYDLLGVDPQASPEEIRTAWRAGIADLDPSDRRFRSLNQAAEVLLDAESRAAYDADLAASEVTPAGGLDARSLALAARPPADPGVGAATSASEERDVAGGRAATSASEERAPAGGRAATSASEERASRPPRRERRPRTPREPREPSRLPLLPAWVLIVAAVLATLGVVTATVAAVRAGEPVADEGGALVERSAEEARSAAVRAIVPVLSYDYRTLEEDAAAARSYMTQSYEDEKYDPLFAVIEENAPNTETVVGAQVVDSAVVRTGDDRVDVLLFVDRPTTNKQVTEPIVYKDQVTVTMARVDGQWLVDDLTTTPITD